jgi:hypothetical protein
MKIAKTRCLGLAICSLILGAITFAQDKAHAKNESTEYKTTVEGLVRDVACPIQNRKATATDFNMKCAVDCAKSGSPLVILTKDGDIYTPISNEMPDPSQREKMMPFVGKYVRATGTVFTRNGTRAISINEIKELKDVKLRTSGD